MYLSPTSEECVLHLPDARFYFGCCRTGAEIDRSSELRTSELRTAAVPCHAVRLLTTFAAHNTSTNTGSVGHPRIARTRTPHLATPRTQLGALVTCRAVSR
eukprot:scaffold329589_cov19-Prasinocladus_malaysianus.AAC.1